MVLIESHVIKFQYLGLIEVLNIRKRERDGESGKRCYELKLQLLWQYSQDHSPSSSSSSSDSSYFSDRRHHHDDSDSDSISEDHHGP